MEFKPSGVLQKQGERVQSLIGLQNPIYPLGRDPLTITQQEAVEKYPFRYGIYKDLLRKGDSVDLTQDKDLERRLKKLSFINTLEGYLSENGGVLRHKQKVAFQSILEGLEQGIDTGYLKLPTGFGKTVMFIELTKLAEKSGLKTVIEVPTKILLNQTQKRFKQFAPDLEVGAFYGDEKDTSKSVTITTYNSFEKLDPDSMDLLILDEAHRGFSESRQHLTKRANSLFKIGFTATPDASEERTLDKILPHRFHAVERREAVRDGILSAYRVIVVKTQADLSNVRFTDTGEFNAEDLDRQINTEVRNRSAVEFYQRAFEGEQAVVYCNSVDHAKKVAEMFNQRGIPTAALYGDMPQSEREAIEEKYDRGEIKVLCNMKLLIEGWDQPKTSVCLNLAPTLSIINADQRGGRVLRTDDTNPHKIAHIVEFVDKNDNPRTQPILFSHLDDVALAPDEKREEIEGRTRELNDKLRNVQIEGLEIIFEEEKVLEVTKEIASKRPKDVPEGWISLARLIESSSRSRGFFNTRLNSELSRKIGGATYVDPGHAATLLEEAAKTPPPDWSVITNVCNVIGISYENAKSIVEEYLDASEGAAYYPGKSQTRQVLYLSPTIVSLLKQKKEEINAQKAERESRRKDVIENRTYHHSSLPKDVFGDISELWFKTEVQRLIETRNRDFVVETLSSSGMPIRRLNQAGIDHLRAQAEERMKDKWSLQKFTRELGFPGEQSKQLFNRILRERRDVITEPFNRGQYYIDSTFAESIINQLKKTK
ncbi:hypothetical protein BH11PAT1_BH11PAT1_0610 [soil metagenome]